MFTDFSNAFIRRAESGTFERYKSQRGESSTSRNEDKSPRQVQRGRRSHEGAMEESHVRRPQVHRSPECSLFAACWFNSLSAWRAAGDGSAGYGLPRRSSRSSSYVTMCGSFAVPVADTYMRQASSHQDKSSPRTFASLASWPTRLLASSRVSRSPSIPMSPVKQPFRLVLSQVEKTRTRAEAAPQRSGRFQLGTRRRCFPDSTNDWALLPERRWRSWRRWS